MGTPMILCNKFYISSGQFILVLYSAATPALNLRQARQSLDWVKFNENWTRNTHLKCRGPGCHQNCQVGTLITD